MLKVRDNLTLSSHLRYLIWRANGCQYDLAVRLMTGQEVIIRKLPARDIDVAYEIFALKIYECPRQVDTKNVKRIVDIGANVGYSCIYWLHKFPNSHVTAFEPHPNHVKQIKIHLERNQKSERVSLLPEAAGIQAGELFLTDMGAESTITTVATEKTIAVPVVDFFAVIGEAEIDLLKIDIEGSEYPLLADSRFELLRVKTCVLEWHNTSNYPDGRNWCINRFNQLGYDVVPGKFEGSSAGLLWAFRKEE